MDATKKVVLGRLGMVGLVVVGAGALVALNWDTVSRNLGHAGVAGM